MHIHRVCLHSFVDVHCSHRYMYCMCCLYCNNIYIFFAYIQGYKPLHSKPVLSQSNKGVKRKRDYGDRKCSKNADKSSSVSVPFRNYNGYMTRSRRSKLKDIQVGKNIFYCLCSIMSSCMYSIYSICIRSLLIETSEQSYFMVEYNAVNNVIMHGYLYMQLLYIMISPKIQFTLFTLNNNILQCQESNIRSRKKIMMTIIQIIIKCAVARGAQRSIFHNHIEEHIS